MGSILVVIISIIIIIIYCSDFLFCCYAILVSMPCVFNVLISQIKSTHNPHLNKDESRTINYFVSTGTAPRNIYYSFGYPDSYCAFLNKGDKTTQRLFAYCPIKEYIIMCANEAITFERPSNIHVGRKTVTDGCISIRFYSCLS